MPCALVLVLVLLGAAAAMLPRSGAPAPAPLSPSGPQLSSPLQSPSISAATAATAVPLLATGALIPLVVTAEVLRHAAGNATALRCLLNPDTVFAERSLVAHRSLALSFFSVSLQSSPY